MNCPLFELWESSGGRSLERSPIVIDERHILGHLPGFYLLVSPLIIIVSQFSRTMKNGERSVSILMHPYGHFNIMASVLIGGNLKSFTLKIHTVI